MATLFDPIENTSSISANSTSLTLSVHAISSHLIKAVVCIPEHIVQAIRDHIIEKYQDTIKPKGLEYSNAPVSYVNDTYEVEINESLKRFILKHLTLDFLFNELYRQKIRSVHRPRLISIDLSPSLMLSYTFNVSSADALDLKDWKLFSFKSPKRKLYKDLDKQVESFIDKAHFFDRSNNHEELEDSDWVSFSSTLLNNAQKAVIPTTGNFWMRLRTRELASNFQTAFLHKKSGDSFITNSLAIDDEIDETISAQSAFAITINSVCKGNNFSVDLFKKTFKLKNKAEIHRKLIEVFSYRDDVSQRRSIIEEIFHLFFSRHRFEVPKHLILRKQEDILLSLKHLPDYSVYKGQKNFDQQIELLAEKQLKEEVLINQIAISENIKIDESDVHGYLHLFNNERLKEFVYFKPCTEQFEELSIPFHDGMLREAVIREKTLNHIIHTFNR